MARSLLAVPAITAAAASTPTPSPAPSLATTPRSSPSHAATFLMPATPARTRRSALDGAKPKMISTIGAKPACLVNASVTYVGEDQIYAFGGFDQYTDEGALSTSCYHAFSHALQSTTMFCALIL